MTIGPFFAAVRGGAGAETLAPTSGPCFLPAPDILFRRSNMSLRVAFQVTIALLTTALCSCGGGGSNSGDGTGGNGGTAGGGGAPALSISILAPSSVMVGSELGTITIFGQDFSEQSQVLLDGQASSYVDFINSSTLQAQIDPSMNATPGTHKFSVQNGSTVSNALTYTVYAPQQGSFVMQAIPGFLVGENEPDPTFIVAADVNGDGLADVIMPGIPMANSGSIAILDGQANGTLATAQYVPVPTMPYALAVGDVDGNGTADLVSITSSNSSTTTVSIMLGDGHGNFQAPVAQQTFTGIYPSQAYLSDLDGDGKPDLVLLVEEPNSIVWLKNTGTGFAAPITLAEWGVTPGVTPNFSVADFNKDGKPDILYTLQATSTTPAALHILMNQGNGNFVDQAAGGLNGIVGFATVLDFNLDGIPDLVVQVIQPNLTIELYSFVGSGTGTFTQVSSLNIPLGPIQFGVGDFDHDGFPDLAGPGGTEPSEIFYLFGDGHGNFVLQTVVGPEGEYVAVGDFNGDGIPDLVVPDRFNFVSLALGRSDRKFPSPLALSPPTVGNISTGDINGDGLPEIFVGGVFDPLDEIFIPGTVFLNRGDSSFQFGANTDPSSFMIADLTGKGVFDLLGGQTSNLEIWPNNLSLDFSASPITLPQAVANITIADMDGDGRPDIVSACPYSVCPGQVLWGNGAYQFSPATVTNLNWPYIVGDFNGDGKLDIATGSSTFLNSGGRTFKEVQGNNLPLSNSVMTAVGDFNGDGKDDVAINLPGDTEIAIYYSNGDGTFYQATQVDPGQYPGAIAVGDFNGDGKLDLAVGLMLSQQVCILFNSGGGQFTRTFYASGASAILIVDSDLNHNGKSDLVIGNFVLDYEPPNIDVIFHQ